MCAMGGVVWWWIVAAVLASPTAALIASSSSPALRSRSPAARSEPVVMGKKTAWSIGNARTKQKKAKAAKPTAATLKGGNAIKGFGMTKEKLAKALGQMTAAEAVDYLAGPEPRQAGISAKVVAALRTEILNAVAAAKKAAVETEGELVERTPSEAVPAMTGPEDNSSEALRRWRAYCAEALVAAEKVQGESDDAQQPTDLASIKSSVDDVPLFKPRSLPTEAPQAQAETKASSDSDSSQSTVNLNVPSGYEWGGTF